MRFIGPNDWLSLILIESVLGCVLRATLISNKSSAQDDNARKAGR
jgi:hypothetical protein